MGKGLHERYLYCKNITQIFVLLWGYDLNLYPCGDGVSANEESLSLSRLVIIRGRLGELRYPDVRELYYGRD